MKTLLRLPLANPRRTSVVILALVFYVWPLTLRIPLLDPDEGLHASIAREMADSGGWITPRFLGKPFFDKPGLLFWPSALSIRLFGASETPLRAVTLAQGALGALTTGLLGAELYGPRVGYGAALVYTTMLLPMSLNQAAVSDVALVPWTNLALWFFFRTRRTEGVDLRNWCAAGLALGLACLTKGLLGVALICLPAAAWLAIRREVTRHAIVGFGIALAIAAAVSAPWFIEMNRLHPGYARYYFVDRHARGYLTATQLHAGRPWWYYSGVLLGGALPWTPLMFAGIGRRRSSTYDRAAVSGGAGTFLWVWIGTSVLFLSLAESKLHTYVLPVFPAVAIAAAVGLQRVCDIEMPVRAARWISGITAFIGSLLLPITLNVIERRFGPSPSLAVWAAAMVISAGWWFMLRPWRPERRRLAAIVASMALTFVFVMSVLLPPVAEHFSARALAEYYNRRGELPGRLLFLDERLGSFVFYLAPPLRAALTAERVSAVSFQNLRAEWARPDVVVAVPLKLATRVPGLGNPRARVGHYLLFSR